MNDNGDVYYTAAATCRLCADADAHLAEARHLAARRTAEIAERTYMRNLTMAYRLYRKAGLGLLAGRVRWLARRENVREAWAKFDKLNAGGCGVA